MKVLLRKGIIIAISLYGGESVYSQSGIPKYEFGINAGTYIYLGDLTPTDLGSFKTPGFGISLFRNRLLNNSFSLRTNLALGKLKGDDSKYPTPGWRQERNFKFTSPVFEISELLVWDILGKNIIAKGFSPYFFGGVGYTFLNIKRDWGNFNKVYFAAEPKVIAGLSADAAHSIPRGIPVLPVGVGVKYALTSKISIHAETSYRYTFTDYLDGFSQAASASKKDSYYSFSIGLIFRSGRKNMLDCPVIPD